MADRIEPVSAFIFDVDGVIADTARLHRAAWKRLADEAALPFDDAQAEAMRGASREQSLKILLAGRNVDSPRFNELMNRKNNYYLEAISNLGPNDVLPGAATLLSDLRKLNIRLAAASASQSASEVLRRLKLLDRFSVVIGPEVPSKPAGIHRFLRAAAALRVEPRSCVVVEDAAAQIAAARSFGMSTVGIGDRRRLCAATLTFESLRGVNARSLLQWMSRPLEQNSASPDCAPLAVAALPA